MMIPQIRQRPVLLLGAPGIGKTRRSWSRLRRSAASGSSPIRSRTIRGRVRSVCRLSRSDEYGGQGIRRDGIYDERDCQRRSIIKWSRPDFNGGHSSLSMRSTACLRRCAPAMLQFLQCKMFGNHAIPQGWVIVAAGNPPEYNKSVREFDVVTMDRVKKIEVEPDFAVWKEYAVTESVASGSHCLSDVRGRRIFTGWRRRSTVENLPHREAGRISRRCFMSMSSCKKIWIGMWSCSIFSMKRSPKILQTIWSCIINIQMDYQLDAVLQGKIDPLLLKKAGNASFDERLSVLSLLLARLPEEHLQRYFRNGRSWSCSLAS